MSKTINEQLDRIVRLQYEKLASDFGYDYEDLVHRFEKRHNVALIKKSNMNIFYKAELEAIEVFRKRAVKHAEDRRKVLRRIAEKKRIAEQKKEAPLKPTNDEKDDKKNKNIENITAIEYFQDATAPPIADDVMENSEYYAQQEKRLRPKYEIYRHEPVHEKASKEIEHLFGCLVDFRKNNLPLLLETMTFVKDKAYRSMVYEVETLLDDAATYDEKGEYPFLFANYIFKLNGSGENVDVINRASIEVFKFVISMLRKIKRVLDWLTHPKARFILDANLNYRGELVSLYDFATMLEEEIKKILKTFGLENL